MNKYVFLDIAKKLNLYIINVSKNILFAFLLWACINKTFFVKFLKYKYLYFGITIS